MSDLVRRWSGFAAGPLVAALVLLAEPAMPPAAQRVAALAAWMAVWWLTSVIPLAETALLPLVFLPLANGTRIEDVARYYADPIVFLFMAGFFLAAASERWGLHRRLALSVIALVGAEASRVVLALMVATAFISMWISNTATAALMLPITVALLELARREAPERARTFGTTLVLGMAYAASIGGVATLIGTPPTAIFAAAARQLAGRPVGFAEWLVIGVPISAVMLAVCWVLLVKLLHPVHGPLAGVAELVQRERAALGPWNAGQVITVTALAATALAWVAREPKTIGGVVLPGLTGLVPTLSDAGIGITAAVVLFVVPVSLSERRFALDWEAAGRIPWGVLLLFGGGLALAAAFESSGLAKWLAGSLSGLSGAPAIVALAAVTLFFVLLTELTSNTATAAMAMPIVASLAPALGADQVGLMAAAALGSAMGFMLPVGTPPNALAYGTGAVSTGEMARAGVWLDVIGAAVITVAVTLWIG
jgi:solute carrier family 13 (sodium-dependent dicarboxylate transporter), member 2/3/5